MIDYESIFLQIRKRFESNENDYNLLNKVYETAKELHKEQKRKDGEPYIIHPVEVANILAELDFNVDVVCAALLHDTVEDCGYSLEQIRLNFNSNIAEMVDCVSAIDKTKYIFDKENVYEDMDFVKSSAEEQTFIKLIAIGKKNPMGFAIKFADRLHNLRTIDCFAYNKQLEKVRETEKWVIPIAQKLNSEYFYTELKNECFKIVNKNFAKTFLEHYDIYHKTNAKNIEKLFLSFEKAFVATNIEKLKITEIKQFEVYNSLKELFKNDNINFVSQGQILKVANYNIYCLCEENKFKLALSDLMNVLSQKLEYKLKIINVNIGKFTHKAYYQLEDSISNIFNLYIMSKDEYTIQKIGTMQGQVDDLIDEDNINNLQSNYIKVKTRSGEIKFVPENSTVLDFAFKLHQDLGFGYKYAIINNSKTQQPPYTKLNDGDQVQIFVERNEKGEIINNAKIKWFAYVNTELAKKKLIKYFEN